MSNVIIVYWYSILRLTFINILVYINVHMEYYMYRDFPLLMCKHFRTSMKCLKGFIFYMFCNVLNLYNRIINTYIKFQKLGATLAFFTIFIQDICLKFYVQYMHHHNALYSYTTVQ